MQIINRVRLREFWNDHDRNEIALRAWFQLMQGTQWESAETLTATFPYAQVHNELVAFDLRGSSLFVICSVDFSGSVLWIRSIQLHNEFHTDTWKSLAAVAPNEHTDYATLVEQFPLRPLRTAEQLGAALKHIDSLLSVADPNDDERDYLDVLSLLVEEYEHNHVPIPPVSGGEIARTLIYEHRLSQAEIIPLLGGKQRATELLKGSRPLDMRQATRCARYFKLPLETFMDPDDLEIELPAPAKRRR
jgi:HTH-type transcriptional regulator / antitoxin HigA